MSARTVACPKCSARLRLPENAAPKSVLRCTKCSTPFRVPAAAPSPTSKAPAPKANARKTTGSGGKQLLQSKAAQQLKQTTKKHWQNPKTRRWILLAGGGVAASALGLMCLFSVVAGWFFFRGGSPELQAANNNDLDNPPVVRLVKGKANLTDRQKFDIIEPIDIKDVKPLLALNADGHSGPVKAVLFSPDGKEVITVSEDKSVRIWSVATGDILRTFRLPFGPGDEGALYAAALSRNGKTLAVGGLPIGRGKFGVLIYLISMDSGRVQRVLKGHTNSIIDLHFSPDGTKLATASTDSTSRIYNVSSGTTLHVLRGHGKRLRDVEFSPNGKYVATVSKDGTTRIWSTESGVTLAVLKHPNEFISCGWRHDSQVIATGCVQSTMQTWTRQGRMLKNYKIQTALWTQVVALAFNNSGDEIMYCGVEHDKGAAGMFNLNTGERRVWNSAHDNTVVDGCLSPDGKLAATAGGDKNEVVIWKTEDASVERVLVGRGQTIWAVGWGIDGKSVAFGHINRGSATNPKALRRLERTFHFSDFELGAAVDPKYARMIAAKNGWSLKALSFTKMEIRRNGVLQRIFTTPSPSDRIYCFTIIPNNRAVVGTAVSLIIIDLNSGRIVQQLFGHSSHVLCVAPSPDGRYFMTGSVDQTMCIWSTKRKQPLMTLFVSGRDWIAWTPEGYYACSAFGERLMGWQINRGPDKIAAYHPAVRFRNSLYKPEAIKLLLQTGDLQKALMQSGQKDNQTVNVAHVLPPQVAIISPSIARPLETDKKAIEVTAITQSIGKHPVTAMRLLLDGRPYKGDRGYLKIPNPALGQRQARWTVELPPGGHEIAVQAESAVSKAVSNSLLVTRNTEREERPNLYVLAVGISAYPGRLRLNYAHADAIAIEKIFQEKSGDLFEKVETKLVIDSNATKSAILEGLGWLKQKMTAKDVGIIFFAGHGAQGPAGDFYLVPVDITRGPIESSCVPGNEIKKKLANIPGRLIAMFDACHSGAAADSKSKGRREFGARADNLARDLVTEDYGVVVMCSSLGSEYSMESPLVGHGFFTLGIIEGLKGGADYNRDRNIFLDEVDRFAARRVQILSSGRQNPVTSRPPTVRSFALSRP